MDAKRAGSALVLVGETSRLGGSIYADMYQPHRASELPEFELDRLVRTAHRVSSVIRTGLVTSAHDCSEGGVLVAAAEMAFAGGIGLSLDFDVLPGTSDFDCAAFGETPGRYLLEVHPDRMDAVHEQLGDVPMTRIGTFNESRTLDLAGRCAWSLDDLRAAWLGTINW